MSFALFGDKKDIWPRNLCTITSRRMYFLSFPLPSPPAGEGHGGMVLNRRGRGVNGGN